MLWTLCASSHIFSFAVLENFRTAEAADHSLFVAFRGRDTNVGSIYRYDKLNDADVAALRAAPSTTKHVNTVVAKTRPYSRVTLNELPESLVAELYALTPDPEKAKEVV